MIRIVGAGRRGMRFEITAAGFLDVYVLMTAAVFFAFWKSARNFFLRFSFFSLVEVVAVASFGESDEARDG